MSTCCKKVCGCGCIGIEPVHMDARVLGVPGHRIKLGAPSVPAAGNWPREAQREESKRKSSSQQQPSSPAKKKREGGGGELGGH